MRRLQEEWAEGGKGRLTFSVCSQLKGIYRGCYLKTVTLLTVHGPFKAYFRIFNQKEENVVERRGRRVGG